MLRQKTWHICDFVVFSAILVQFVYGNESDNITTGVSKNFQLLPSPALQGCGQTIEKDTGTITSPNYPQNYPSNLDCTWDIKVQELKIIKIEFQFINIEEDSSCSYDKLHIQEKKGQKFKTISTICGSRIPSPLRTKSNIVRLRLKTDESENRKGFKLIWKAVSESQGCGNSTFNTSSGALESPNFPNPYPNNLNCSFQIETMQGYKISIKIQELDIEYGSGCEYDSLKVYDVGLSSTQLIGTYCGRKLPLSNLTTSGNKALVRFKTDDSTSDKGFHLTWISRPAVDTRSGNSTCGMKNHVIRIVGGTIAARGEFPWQVGFFWRTGIAKGKFFCGGALIEDRWILTAAHCFVNGRNESLYKVTIGDHNIRFQEGNEQEANVSSIVVHPDYNDQTHDNDIALVQLASKLILGVFTNTLCLPTRRPPVGTRCLIAGWGTTAENGPASDILMKAEVPLVSRKICSHEDVYGLKITTNMMCAGYARGGVDTCQGDSGGPLHCRSRENSKRWEVQGIVSWGRGCGRQMKYGVYTIVWNYLAWIIENTGQRNSSSVHIQRKSICPDRIGNTIMNNKEIKLTNSLKTLAFSETKKQSYFQAKVSELRTDLLTKTLNTPRLLSTNFKVNSKNMHSTFDAQQTKAEGHSFFFKTTLSYGMWKTPVTDEESRAPHKSSNFQTTTQQMFQNSMADLRPTMSKEISLGSEKQKTIYFQSTTTQQMLDLNTTQDSMADLSSTISKEISLASEKQRAIYFQRTTTILNTSQILMTGFSPSASKEVLLGSESKIDATIYHQSTKRNTSDNHQHQIASSHYYVQQNETGALHRPNGITTTNFVTSMSVTETDVSNKTSLLSSFTNSNASFSNNGTFAQTPFQDTTNNRSFQKATGFRAISGIAASTNKNTGTSAINTTLIFYSAHKTAMKMSSSTIKEWAKTTKIKTRSSGNISRQATLQILFLQVAFFLIR